MTGTLLVGRIAGGAGQSPRDARRRPGLFPEPAPRPAPARRHRPGAPPCRRGASSTPPAATTSGASTAATTTAPSPPAPGRPVVLDYAALCEDFLDFGARRSRGPADPRDLAARARPRVAGRQIVDDGVLTGLDLPDAEREFHGPGTLDCRVRCRGNGPVTGDGASPSGPATRADNTSTAADEGRTTAGEVVEDRRLPGSDSGRPGGAVPSHAETHPQESWTPAHQGIRGNVRRICHRFQTWSTSCELRAHLPVRDVRPRLVLDVETMLQRIHESLKLGSIHWRYPPKTRGRHRQSVMVRARQRRFDPLRQLCSLPLVELCDLPHPPLHCGQSAYMAYLQERPFGLPCREGPQEFPMSIRHASDNVGHQLSRIRTSTSNPTGASIIPARPRSNSAPISPRTGARNLSMGR